MYSTTISLSFLIFIIFVPILVLILLGANLLLAVHIAYPEKLAIYECGFEAIGEQTRSSFHIPFLLLAVVFLVFDLELILFTPLCTSLANVESFGVIMAILFFTILTLGFIFEISKGVADVNANH